MPSRVGEDGGRLRVAELVLRPREDRAGVLAVPLRRRDGDDAERQQRVLLAQADDGDPLGRLLDRRRAVLVLDRDGEARPASAVVLRASRTRAAALVVLAAGPASVTAPARARRAASVGKRMVRAP